MNGDVFGCAPTPNRRASRARLLSLSALVCCLLGVLEPSASPAQTTKIVVHSIKLPVVPGNDIRFTRFSPADGLSQIRVSEIVQDNQGFMWFGTEYGLNRYDGYNFKVFAHDPRNPNSLSGVFIEALFKDRNGAMWISSGQFLNKCDPLTETFRRFPIQLVNHISQDSAGKLWLATGRGLYSLEESTGEVRQFSHDPIDPSSLPSNDVKWSGEDREGGFWVATNEGLDEFDRQTGKVALHIPLREPLHEFGFYEDSRGVFWIFHVSGGGLAVFDRKNKILKQYSFHDRPPSGSAITGVKALLEDRNGNLWIGTQGSGLLKFDQEHERFISYRHNLADPESLAEDSVNALYEDYEGNIWTALGAQGLNRFSVRSVPFQKLPYDARRPFQKGETMVNAITGDGQGTLWTSTREALNRIDLKTGQYANYRVNDVVTLAVDRKGILWAGTYNDGLSRVDPATRHVKVYRHDGTNPWSLSNNIVARLLVDHSGTLWAATYDGLNRFDESTERFTTYKVDPKLKDLFYIELVEDRSGMLWLGTHSEGLQRFDPRTGLFTTYAHDENRSDSLSDDRVNSVHFDRSGVMWVGTQNGLNRFNAITSTFTAYTTQDGLAGNAVSCILEDGNRDLWVSTNNGISRFSPSTKRFKNFSPADGLPGLDLTGWGACYKDPHGEMFFGGFSGGTSFFPEQVRGNTYTPPVVLTDFRLFGNSVGIGGPSLLARPISYTSEISLAHKQNAFSFTFAALSYSDPVGNRYRYKLDGLDRDWTETGSDRRSASYTTLPPGSYVFRVQGATSSGAYGEPGVALRIRVLPAWWSTWWFRTAFVVLLLIFTTAAYNYRLRQLARHFNARLEERIRERTRIARDLHDTLLQSLHGLMFQFQAARNMLPQRPAEASQTLDRAIGVTQQAITESQDAITDLRPAPTASSDLGGLLMATGKELETTGNPNGTGATFGLTVEGERQTLSPILQDEVYRIALELLRNAFRHACARRVEAEVRYDDEQLRVRIRDDGKGMDPEVLKKGRRPGHWGLLGAKERAQRIGAHLDIWSEAGAGTEVQLSIPATVAYKNSHDRPRFRFFRRVTDHEHRF